MEDQPECLGRYSEGGSSGSAEGHIVPPTVEAPSVEEAPPLPPPPQDPIVPAEASPVEVAPSRGDEVRQRIAEAPSRLEVKAYRALEDEFIAVAKLEDLGPEDRRKHKAVRDTG